MVSSKTGFADGCCACGGQAALLRAGPALVADEIEGQAVFFRLRLPLGFFPDGGVQGRKEGIAFYVCVDFRGDDFMGKIQGMAEQLFAAYEDRKSTRLNSSH